jgi:hypothetical protein
MKKQILAALITAATMGSASAAVVFSENFDSYTIASGTYQTYTSPGTLGAWSIIGSVDIVSQAGGNPYGAINMLSLDNAGTPGSTDGISTLISTVAGATYTLDFDYSRNAGNSAYLTSTSNLTFGGVNALLTVSNGLYAAPPVLHYTNSFVGTGSPLTLSFLSPTTNNSWGITLDNITVNETLVAAIPEPGEWAMMLSGLAVVGAIARRRRVRT